MIQLAKNFRVFSKLRSLTVVAKMIPLDMNVLRKKGMARKVGNKFVLIRQRKEKVATQYDDNVYIGEGPQPETEQTYTAEERPAPQLDMASSSGAGEDVKHT